MAAVGSLPHAIDALIPSLCRQCDTRQYVRNVLRYTGTAVTHINVGARKGLHSYLDDLSYPESELKGLSTVH